jgi:hypothetical protein
MFEAIRAEYGESKAWANKENLIMKPIDGEPMEYAYWKMAKAIADGNDGSLEDKMKTVRDSWRSFLVTTFR